jgi:hypothetical protein
VYNYGKATNCMEVCVEDPSREFQKMRDTVDLQNFRQVEKSMFQLVRKLIFKM